MTQPLVPLAGVIGDPVAHSLSPRLHGHWLQRHGLRGHYVPLQVAAADLTLALTALPRVGFVGANVTIPHKEAVLELADSVSDTAARIGAANTLTFTPGGGVHADNSDAEGFVASLRAGAPDWRPAAGPAAVFGAGGAARAVLWGLLAAGVPEIRLTNRTAARAEALADRFGPKIRVVPWDSFGDALEEAALAVNTTSLGMAGQPPFPAVLDRLAPGAVATDIVYAPLETPFLASARARGAVCVDGLGMLLHQAVPGFERWFGLRPEVDAALRAAVLA